jgi:hypothetical protein
MQSARIFRSPLVLAAACLAFAAPEASAAHKAGPRNTVKHTAVRLPAPTAQLASLQFEPAAPSARTAKRPVRRIGPRNTLVR